MASKAAYFTVRESFIGNLAGHEVEYQKGEVVDADDPALARWPDHFVPLIVRRSSQAQVEQATASPGERR